MIRVYYKTRPPIFQAKLEDFTGEYKDECYDMSNSREYRAARKKLARWLPVEKRARRAQAGTPPVPASQRTIFDFMPELEESPVDSAPAPAPEEPSQPSSPAQELPPLPRMPFFGRFRSIPSTTYEYYAEGVISRMEWDMLQAFPTFNGLFNHLFEFNDFAFFDSAQAELKELGANFRGAFLYDVVAFELLRRQLGFRDFMGIEKVAQFIDGNPLVGVLHNPEYFPSAASISFTLKQVPAAYFMDYFHQQVREGLDAGIIAGRVLIWDGQFIRSNCRNNADKETGAYTDPDAGYARHIGKKLGVGYQPGILYDYSGPARRMPVHFTMFPGNRNDNPAFRGTIGEFWSLDLSSTYRVAMSDAGAYSVKSLNDCASLGWWPFLRAKKNIKNQPTRELKEGYWFNTDFIPPGWSDEDFLTVYGWRPAIESGNAEHNTFYSGQRMNTRGMENATKTRALDFILDWGKAIAAYKLNRSDLTCKWLAFSHAREYHSYLMWSDEAEKSGYQPLPFP